MRISQFMLIGALSLLAGPVLADAARLSDYAVEKSAAAQAGMLQPRSWSDPALAPAVWRAAEQTPPAAAPWKAAARMAADKRDSIELLETAQTTLAWELIYRLSKDDGADSTVSPASLASAFAILAQGADAAMKAAIVKALGFGAADTTKSVAALINARATLAANNGGLFESADRIVFAPDSAPSRGLAARLKQLGVDFTADDLSKPDAAAKIDAWVNEVTKGAIPEILGGPLDKASFVVLNALHFKGRWKTQFDPHLTAQAPFQSADGKSGEVAMMRLPKASRAYRIEQNFIGVDLPFSNERFSLVVVTTMDKPAPAGDFAAAKKWLSGAGFTERKGDLALPRFKTSERSDLLPTLDALGLDKGRNSPTALARFGQGTRLTRVVQRAMIEVDEEGAEAAAATAVFGLRAVDDSLHMVVDKPFIFALRDRQTGLILVAGYVGHAPSD